MGLRSSAWIPVPPAQRPRYLSLSIPLRPPAPLSPGTIVKAGKLHVLAFAEGDGVKALAAEEHQPLIESSQSAEISEAMPSEVVLIKARLWSGRLLD